MDLRNIPTITQRRKKIEEELGVFLSHMASHSLDEEQASSKHCENMIGAIEVPVGIAGPLLVQSITSSVSLRQESKVQSYYIPLATTEGALVASVNRGCKAITESGGVIVRSEKVGITRAPVFAVSNLLEGEKLISYIEKNFSQIKKAAESTSSHLTLLDIKPWALGKNVFLRLRFDPQDAMGMNMATIAASNAAMLIEKETKAKLISVSGNMCVDKKPNMLNFIEGRGYKVWAEAIIPEKILSQILKTTSEKLVQTAQVKLTYGSLLSGTIGANAHAANIIAGIFLATGQDIAHVAECSSSITIVEPAQQVKGIYISVYMPDCIVGTVGGGTMLSPQKEALSIMGISGGDNGKNSQRLAEIVGSAVLAGEISLLASLSENTLAKAHQKLGRGMK